MMAGRSTFPITELLELLLLGDGEAGLSSGGFLVLLLMLPLMLLLLLLSTTGGFVMLNVC